jgi:excisionase family DNA binding protein
MTIGSVSGDVVDSDLAAIPAQDRAPLDDLHELLTVDEVARLLKVSRSWVYEHTRSRGTPRSERLPHIKVGKYIRFEPRALRAFIEKKCRTT